MRLAERRHVGGRRRPEVEHKRVVLEPVREPSPFGLAVAPAPLVQREVEGQLRDRAGAHGGDVPREAVVGRRVQRVAIDVLRKLLRQLRDARARLRLARAVGMERRADHPRVRECADDLRALEPTRADRQHVGLQLQHPRVPEAARLGERTVEQVVRPQRPRRAPPQLVVPVGGTGKVRALHEDAAETRARRRPARQLLHARAAPRRIGAVAAAAAAIVVEEEVGSGWLRALAWREEAPQLQRTLNRRHVEVGERHLDEEGGAPATRRRHPDAAARAAPPRLVSSLKALLDGVPQHGTRGTCSQRIGFLLFAAQVILLVTVSSFGQAVAPSRSRCARVRSSSRWSRRG